jgi:probable phosphoglycerate mutase
MRLILVRHGAVAPPRPLTFYGGSEVPLSETGRAEAAAAAAALSSWQLDHVVSSPLSRARYGAERIAEGRGLQGAPEPAEHFREIDRGRWVGLTQDEIRERWPGDLEAHARDPRSWRGHAGESLEDLRRRVLQGRAELEERWPDRAVALVAHLYPIRALTAEATGQGLEEWESIKIPTGSITLIERTRAGWRLERLAWRPELGQVLPGFSTEFSTGSSTKGPEAGE